VDKLKPKTDVKMGDIMAPPPIPATEENTLTANIRMLPAVSRSALRWNRDDLQQRAAEEPGQTAHWYALPQGDSLKDVLQAGSSSGSAGQMKPEVSMAEA
jgi:hypothetical protein